MFDCGLDVSMRETAIPAHTEHDDLPVEMVAFEKITYAQHGGQPSSSRQICSACAVCTRAGSSTHHHSRQRPGTTMGRSSTLGFNGYPVY